MSGEFRPEQNATVEATDDPALAQQYGLTEFDDERGQYVALAESESDWLDDDEVDDDEPTTGEAAHYATPDDDE